MMSRKMEFAKNTIILAIGRFSTQLVSFLCIPIYTHYLLSEDYGLIDLYQTIISFFIPIVTLRLDVAAFRYLSDFRKDEKRKQDYLMSVLVLLVATSIVSALIGIVLSLFIQIKFLPLVLVNLVALSIATVLQHSLRGLKLNKEYSVCSLLTSGLLLLTTVLLIVVLKLDGRSILIASAIANSFNALYCLAKLKPKFNRSKKLFSNESKEMLAYSAPMILDATSWWIVSVSDRAIISYFIGVAANGIYSVSCKISNILNSLFLIFNLAWQEAIISHKDDSDGELYLSRLGNEILKLFLAISVLAVSLIPLLFGVIIGEEFSDAYEYIPILIYANIFSIISTLTGSILVIFKKTKTIARTTILSAVINTAINLCLVWKIGIYAAAFSTLISYTIIAAYRYYICKKIISFKLDIKMILIYTMLYLGCWIVYLQKNILMSVPCALLSLVVIIIANKRIIMSFLGKFMEKQKHSNLSKKVD